MGGDVMGPAGAYIRQATPADAGGIASVHVESWRSTYAGILPDDFLVRLSVPAYTARWRRLLGEREGGRRTLIGLTAEGIPVGFASCGPQRTSIHGYAGEFYAIYLADHVHGAGWGRYMLGSMAQELLKEGMRSAVVWVLRENPSRWFYERMGGQLLAEQPISFAGARLTEVAYGWEDLVPLSRCGAGPRVW
ncbi:GNAT family N-acetyltransferase [Indioceanicola profundi]|uniref:GNAT family N-acetyltransferase n=1 Tax=Indioceanicola profundi TaxID=2220096 RepID=UPI001CEDBEB4|nr:GNAT family N-acetyltransferase [Indioceanicola profundi]